VPVVLSFRRYDPLLQSIEVTFVDLVAAMRDPIFADSVDAHERARNLEFSASYVLETKGPKE